MTIYRSHADPHYALHVGPTRAWASTWWDTWADPKQLKNTFQSARKRINNGSGARVGGLRHLPKAQMALR